MAARYDLSIDQAAIYRRVISWANDDKTPVDLTGYTAAAQLRTRPDAADPAAVFTVTLDEPNGTVTVELDATATANLEPSHSYVWDLLLTSPTGEATRLLEGSVHVSGRVTR